MYYPPRPKPLPAIAALIRAIVRRDGDLLSLLPDYAYKKKVGKLGYSRRSILIVNDPQISRQIMTRDIENYPKNDLMVGALEPLVGNSIFVSAGDAWRRQRQMIGPAFSHIRIKTAFTSMTAAVDDYEARLDHHAQKEEPFSLDLAMSHLTADIICRTVFTTSLQTKTAQEVFDAFGLFERSVAHVELKRLIFDPAWTDVPQHQSVLDACALIRMRLGEFVDEHLEASGDTFDDMASAVIAATDAETGKPFTRSELIDQLGVFFLAGHETTASVLIWVFFIAATQPEILLRIRQELDERLGENEITIEDTKRLTYIQNVFSETLRLYPPITFIPRIAAESTMIGSVRAKKGAMIMISPWTIHRHDEYWPDPHAFDPDRFLPSRESEIVPGAYIPFGQGPRVCMGASFATVEATLILARLLSRFDFEVVQPERVRPVARLTTRPKEQVFCRVRRRADKPS